MAFVFSLVTFVVMDNIEYSFIIPVYNRPNEINELLESFMAIEGQINFEIVIVEDGSSETSKEVIEQFQSHLDISYYYKENSGPGDSRNYGMNKARGNYFIILDSDVLLPPNYLKCVNEYLLNSYYDCYGGPDAAHKSFSNLQKAINFSMTSFMTTGGIRGGKKQVENFQPRSFNMGLSKQAFDATSGFGDIHPGEDPDLSLRLRKLGFNTTLIEDAFVYHKRRISWAKFYQQVYKFGLVRPILNSWHPESNSLVYWFPSLFTIGLILGMVLEIFEMPMVLYFYLAYFSIAFLWSSVINKNIVVGLQSIMAIMVQFFGYGYGFLKSTIAISLMGKNPRTVFPQLFFK